MKNIFKPWLWFKQDVKVIATGISTVEQPTVEPVVVTTNEAQPKATNIVKNDTKGKNYKKNSRRGKSRSKGDKANS